MALIRYFKRLLKNIDIEKQIRTISYEMRLISNASNFSDEQKSKIILRNLKAISYLESQKELL